MEPGDRLAALARRAADELQRRFGRPPRWLAAAPGRVNLIGEHTDYNDGFVLPMAIDRHTVVAAAPADTAAGPPRLRLVSLAKDVGPDQHPQAQPVSLSLDATLAPGPPRWTSYVRGVVAGVLARGARPPSLDVVVASDLPLGGGLSSSAALEVATATLLAAAGALALPTLEIARLCRRAEQEWAGVPCGIMDQLASAAGQAGQALLIDCQDETVREVALPAADAAVLVTNTGVRHALADGTYARRRAECQRAAELLGVPSLRAATPEALAQAGALLPADIAARARHVVSENARTLAAAEALAGGDLAGAGRLMYQSHRSLRDDYQVSCPELDALVDIAGGIGEAGGVFGARLTGGGFGGCTVTLVRRDRVAEVAAALGAQYQQRTGRASEPFVVEAAPGARLL
jgi:galactokinase